MTAPIDKASFYADFGALAALKRDAKAEDPKALRAAAQQFESIFTEMMLKSMRAATPGDAMTGSNEMDFYQGMFDQQLAVQLSKGRGLGLADMLVQQLTRSGLVATPSDQTVGRALGEPFPSVTARLEDVGLKPDLQNSGVAATPPADRPDLQHAAKATTISATDWPPATPEEFVQRMLPHARQAAAQLGVDATTLVAHAALETGWGRHMPASAAGGPSFNFFGIKATPSWSGQSVASATLEFQQGVAVQRVERFRAYDSPLDCFSDYADLLQQRYQSANHTGTDAAGFARALQQQGYATDPHYAAKLTAVAGAVRAIQVGASGADT